MASSSNGQWLAAVSSDSGTGRIYTSDDYGQNWDVRNAPGPFGDAQAWASIAISDSGKEMVAAVQYGQIYTSVDYGETWVGNPITDFREWAAVAMASGTNGQKLVALERFGPIHVSDDGGATWNPRGPIREWASVAVSSDGQTIVAVADESVIYVSANGGGSWLGRESARRWTSVACSADCTKIVAAEKSGSIYTSVPARITVADGWLAGGQYDAVDLLFVGEGVWIVPDFTVQAGSHFTVH